MDIDLDLNQDDKQIFIYPDGSIYAPWACLFQDDSDDNEEK